MKKKEKDFQIDGQLSIFDMLQIPSDIDKTYSPSEIIYASITNVPYENSLL